MMIAVFENDFKNAYNKLGCKKDIHILLQQ